MSIGVGKEARIRQASQYVPYNRSGGAALQTGRPGRAVGVIAVKPKGLKDNEYNPLVMYFTVNRYRPRKDLNTVIDQTNKKKDLTGYAADLFDSCFKNW